MRWSDEPLPEEAKVSLFGVCFAAASTSATVFSGEAAGTTSTLGACTATISRSKSLLMS